MTKILDGNKLIKLNFFERIHFSILKRNAKKETIKKFNKRLKEKIQDVKTYSEYKSRIYFKAIKPYRYHWAKGLKKTALNDGYKEALDNIGHKYLIVSDGVGDYYFDISYYTENMYELLSKEEYKD